WSLVQYLQYVGNLRDNHIKLLLLTSRARKQADGSSKHSGGNRAGRRYLLRNRGIQRRRRAPTLYDVKNTDEHIFCVVAPHDPSDPNALPAVMARIFSDQVIIDQDKSSISLYTALVQAGLPENQIIMARKLKQA